MTSHTTGQVRQGSDELRRLREELDRYGELLLTIQKSILPQHLPRVPGLDLAVHFADADGVGGDYYDVRPVGDHHWAIVVADVVGHGLASAAILALVHALGNALQDQPAPPSAALASINKPLAARYLANTGEFVTIFVALYDTKTRVLAYSSAEHPPPRLVRGKQVLRLDAVSGLPLGIDQRSVYKDDRLQLAAGDRLVLFTDGITEGINPAREMFGEPRFDELLRAPTARAAEFLDHLVHSVRAFRAGQPPRDDETCLVAVVKPIGAVAQGESEVVRC